MERIAEFLPDWATGLIVLALAHIGRRDEVEIKDAAVKVINRNDILAERSASRQWVTGR